jgi:hypothetical protein
VVFVDRSGHESPALPRRDRYNNPRLSPDRSRVSVDIRSANSMGDVWVFEAGRTGGTRLTAEEGREFGGEWTPDGSELIFSSERPFFDLYRRAADATRPAEPLLTGGYDHYTGSVELRCHPRRPVLSDDEAAARTAAPANHGRAELVRGTAGPVPALTQLHDHSTAGRQPGRTGAILASIFRADIAFFLRKAFQSPSARRCRRSVR